MIYLQKINLITNEHFKNVSLRSNLSTIDRNDYLIDYQLKVKVLLINNIKWRKYLTLMKKIYIDILTKL